ncbi:MAG TPA: flagellar export chaperone FliS [Terriglobales bacterium]|nr:flagellar export chaperone FliS [Terriglobales bacterium]
MDNIRANPVAAYRRSAIEGASPVQLVGLLYEGVIAALHVSVRAVKAGEIETRVREINRAMAILAELGASLDLERGGEVAATLRRFYNIAQGRMLEASIKQSAPILEELISQFRGLRDSWRRVERDAQVAHQLQPTAFRPAEAVGAAWGA